jgi:hypothetical protein
MTPDHSVPAIRTPTRALNRLRNALVPVDVPSDAVIEIIIRIDQTHLNIREFTAYLDFIDRTYGRLTPEGLTSYAHKRWAQLEIASVRSGSVEIVISELVSNSDDVTRLIIIYLLLKYAPTMATAYRDYEEARFTRERRKQLREQMQEDTEIAALDRELKNQLVRFFDSCYQQEQRRIPRVRRFAGRYVRRVYLQFKRRDDGQNNHEKTDR